MCLYILMKTFMLVESYCAAKIRIIMTIFLTGCRCGRFSTKYVLKDGVPDPSADRLSPSSHESRVLYLSRKQESNNYFFSVSAVYVSASLSPTCTHYLDAVINFSCGFFYEQLLMN